MQKRVLAFLMVLAMVVSLLPVSLVAAETATAEPGYTLVLQKAHNQTEGSLAVEIYLQANTAGQADVTGYQFQVTPAEGVTITNVVDASGNDGLAYTDGLAIYAPGKPVLSVGTTKKLITTITVDGTLPATLAETFTLAGASVTTADAEFVPAQVVVEDGCTAHDCAHGTGTWVALTAAKLTELNYVLPTGNYYMAEDITATKKLTISDADAQINLCLNGYTYTSPKDKMIEITGKSADVFICDCTATGEGQELKAGKFLLTYANWGNLRVNAAEATLTTYNIILEGAEDAIFADKDVSNVGNAATYYQTAAAVNSKVYAENVLIRDIHADKTLIDTRAEGYYKNVTFVNCSGGRNNASDELAIFTTNGDYAKSGTRALTIDGCKFIDCGRVLDTQSKSAIVYTLKGDVWAEDEFYVGTGNYCKLNLDLGKNAKVTISTQYSLTPEEFGELIKVVEGGSVTPGTVEYKNVGSYASYEDGAWQFSSHVHDEESFKVWNDANSLPTEGNWYLDCDVTVAKETTVSAGKTLNLCLNGHTITQTKDKTRVYWIDGVMNLYDCAEEYDAEGNWTGGVITGGTNIVGGCIRIDRSVAGKLTDADRPTFNMYGGRVAGNGNTASDTSGGAIYVTSSRNAKEGAQDERGGVFNMYGGELYDNHTDTLGGAVTVWGLSTTRDKDGIRRALEEGLGAEFNMYGGKIHGNSSNKGGAVHIYRDAVFNMYDGEFANNEGRLGGAVHGTDATINIEGGYFTGNSAKCRGASADYGRGGAIFAEGASADVTIANAVFEENSSNDDRATSTSYSGSGGAICFYNNQKGTKPFMVKDCQFLNNTANRPNSGNDYAGIGGALFVYNAKATIEGCLLEGNSSVNRHGGAVGSRGDGNVILLKDCQILNNTAAGAGGAIYYSGAQVYTLQDTIVSGNSSVSGGAVYVTSVTSRLVLSGSTVVAGNERTSTIVQADVYFQGQTTRENLLEVNELTDGAHANVYFGSTSSPAWAAGASGLVRLSDDGGTQTDWDCGWLTIYKNSDAGAGQNVSYMDTDGDGVKEFVFGHFHTMADGTLQEYTKWTATTAPTKTGYYYLSKDLTTSEKWNITVDMHLCFNGKTLTSGADAALRLPNQDEGITLTVDDCTGAVVGNEYIGGGITGTKNAFGSGIRLDATTNSSHKVIWNGGAVKNCVSKATNTNSSGGAAIFFQGTSGNYKTYGELVFNGGAVYGNQTNDDNEKSTSTVCGPIQINQGKMTINGGLFYGNSCTDKGSSNQSMGGLIYLGSGSLIINDGYFYDNYSEDRGGVITNRANLEIYGGTFEGNYVTQGMGGVINMPNTGAKLKIQGTAEKPVKFLYNEAYQLETSKTDATTGETTVSKTLGNGGAIEIANNAAGQASISYAYFEGNYAEYRGGAISFDDGESAADLKIDNCEFVGNEADNRGGAIMAGNVDKGTCSMDITNTLFEGNTAAEAGGAIVAGNKITLTVDGCEFLDNSAKESGGAFYSQNSNVNITIQNSLFEGNSAKNGGALMPTYYTTFKLLGSTVKNNEASGNGGGLHLGGSGATNKATIGGAGDEGCTFTGNKAKNAAAIFANSKASSTVTNCVITGNEAADLSSGVHVEGNHMMTMADCTITGNTSDSLGGLVLYSDRCSLTLTGKMIVENNTCNNYAAYSPMSGLVMRKDTATTPSEAHLDVSGLTEGSRIGVYMTADRGATDPVFTKNGGAVAKDYFYSTAPDRCQLTVKDGELMIAKHIDEEGNAYGTVQEAITAAEAAGKTSFQLQATSSNTTKLTLTTITELDLNGHSTGEVTVAEGKELTLIDTAANGYEASGATVKVKGAVKPFAEFGSGNTIKRYAVIANEDGTVSAHRIYLAINAKTLRPFNNGVGFKAIFAGDDVVAANVTYGIELSGYSDFNQVWTASFEEMEAGATSSTPNQKTVVIYDAISAEDQSAWDDDLYGRPFITINGQTHYGKTVTVNMKDMAQAALASSDVTVVEAVKAMMAECGVSAN